MGAFFPGSSLHFRFKERNNINSLHKRTFTKGLGGAWPPCPLATPLASASWDDIVNDNDVNNSYRNFVDIFFETFNSSFPFKPGSPPKKGKHKPWMTKVL